MNSRAQRHVNGMQRRHGHHWHGGSALTTVFFLKEQTRE